MLKVFHRSTLLSLIIITSFSLSGCNWVGIFRWCRRNCDIDNIDLLPIPPKHKFTPTVPPYNPSSQQSQQSIQWAIELAARQAALDYWEQQNGQLIFEQLYQVSYAEAEQQTMLRGAMSIIGGTTGLSAIAYSAANSVWTEKTRRT